MIGSHLNLLIFPAVAIRLKEGNFVAAFDFRPVKLITQLEDPCPV